MPLYNPTTGGAGTPGGTSGQIQINSSGSFGGISTVSSSQLPVGVNHPGYVAGNWYYPLGPSNIQNSGGPNLTTAYCSIGQIGGNSSLTISALAMHTTANGGNIQLAIYNNDLSSGQARPGTLVDSTPNIVASTAGNLSGNLNATHSIQPGFYWFCMQTDNAALRYYYPSGSNMTVATTLIGSSNIGNVLNGGLDGVSTTTGISAFGTWPSFVGATFAEEFNTAPAAVFKFSSVP